MDPTQLTSLGLTSQQSSLYLKLLELGPSSVGNITKHLSIARISCYDTLNRLISRGLVSYINTRGAKLYQATPPQSLLDIAKEHQLAATQQTKTIEHLLPQLQKIQHRTSPDETNATIYKTKQGMKSIFELMLTTNKPIYIISATGIALKEMKYYFPQWHARRLKLHLPVHIIFNEELQHKPLTKIPLSYIRYLPKAYSSPSTIFIFGSCVVTLLWSDVPFAFLLQSSKIAHSYENYFKLLWKQSKK